MVLILFFTKNLQNNLDTNFILRMAKNCECIKISKRCIDVEDKRIIDLKLLRCYQLTGQGCSLFITLS